MFLVTSLVIRKEGKSISEWAQRGGLRERQVLTALANAATSSLKDSDEQTSPPVEPGSRGVQVASSHFSKINANRGKSG